MTSRRGGCSKCAIKHILPQQPAAVSTPLLGQYHFDSLRLLLYSRELLDKVLDRVAEMASVEDRGVKKFLFVSLLHICQVQP